MGREWYWTRSMRRGGEREMSSAAGSTTTAAAGCITSLLHLFDFHQFQCSSSHFPSPASSSSSSSASASASASAQKQQQQLSLPPKKQPKDAAADDDLFLLQYSISDKKGVEAPRNSLEMDVDPLMVAASPTSPISAVKEAEDDIPFCIQLLPVKASPSLQRDQEANYQKSPTSQGSKTPNLVARLMGLDLLPGEIASATSSPVFRTRKLPYSRHLKESGSRSLPDSPRISSARRSDVDPRLSLQINKENIDMSEFNSRVSKENTLFSNSAVISSRRGGKRESKLRSHEEGKSPNRYVKEMVKQVKESVSRKVGADITNLRNQGRDGEKNSAINMGIKKTKGKEEQNQNKNSSPKNSSPSSSSPRLRLFESKNTKLEAEDQSRKQGTPPAQLKKTKTKAGRSSPMPKSGTKFDKASCERFTRKPKKSCHSEGAQSLRDDVLRRAAFSKQQCYQIEGHVAVPSKPDPDPVQASSSLCPGQGPTPLETRDDNSVTAEFRYVRAILNRTGIQYSSPSHPLDPSLFRTLESASSSHLHVSTLRLRPNRKLLFHLADEILAGLLRPHFNLKPWMHNTWRHPVCGEDFSVQLWARVREFRGADCQTLQDIDGLVGSDFSEKPGGGDTWRLTEEQEAIACEIEQEIAESLLEEAVSGLTQPGPISGPSESVIPYRNGGAMRWQGI